MDPLSALSVASSIVQFIEFGNKLVGKGFQIYKSADGALAENVDKEVVVHDLIHLNERLETSILRKAPEKLNNESENHALSALYALCSRCRILGEELLAHLRALRVEGRNRKWRSFRQALKSVLAEEAIDEIGKRLATFRDELEFHVLVDLR
jgi:hypothetical protein